LTLHTAEAVGFLIGSLKVLQKKKFLSMYLLMRSLDFLQSSLLRVKTMSGLSTILFTQG
jgi:hypothetical protein